MERNEDERRIQRGKSRGKETAVLSRVASGQGNRREQPGKQAFVYIRRYFNAATGSRARRLSTGNASLAARKTRRDEGRDEENEHGAGV